MTQNDSKNEWKGHEWVKLTINIRKKWKGLEIIKNDQKWQSVIIGEKWQKMTGNDAKRIKYMFWNWCDTLISAVQPLKCSKMTKHDFESFWGKMTKW